MSNVPHRDRPPCLKPVVAALAVLIGVPLLLAGCRQSAMVPDSPEAVQLRIATWNLEHLNDTEDAGCVPRDEADYDAIADRIREIAPDVVAFQEVENMEAALRVFPATHWHVEVSTRPEPAEATRECWGLPGKYLHHQATGFAIRKEIVYQRHEDLESLGDPVSSQRWGTDITVTFGDRTLRLLSVHLKSGCWSAEQDASEVPHADLRHTERPGPRTQILGRPPGGRADRFRHPGRLQPPSRHKRRLGLERAVAGIISARPPHRGHRNSVRSAIRRIHRPHRARPDCGSIACRGIDA